MRILKIRLPKKGEQNILRELFWRNTEENRRHEQSIRHWMKTTKAGKAYARFLKRKERTSSKLLHKIFLSLNRGE